MIGQDTGKDKEMPLGPKEEALRAQRLAAIADGKPEKAPKVPKAPRKARSASKPKKARKIAKAKATRTSEPRKGVKTAIIRELLTRVGGCTTAEVLAETGWKAVSMPDQARRLGVELKTEKDGRIARYWIA
jgi:hypothetical protein